MRRAVAGFCCVVVALEVLIGVPLVVCLGVLMLAQDFGVRVPVGQAYYASSSPVPFDPCVPPPLATYSSTPIPSAPYSPPAVSPVPNPWTPQVAPMPTAMDSGPAPKVSKSAVAAEEPKSPELDAVLPTRAEIGSPLAGTTLDAEDPDDSKTAFAAAFNQVAKSEDDSDAGAPSEEAPATEADSRPTLSPGKEAKSNVGAVPSLEEALDHAVAHLYELSQRYEEDSNFKRADAVRSLARELRRESWTIEAEKPRPEPPPVVPAEDAGELPYAPAQ